MTHPLGDRAVKLLGHRLKLIQRHVAQFFHREEARAGFTLFAAGVVFAIHQAAFDVGVDDNHRDIVLHRHRSGAQRATVDQQGMVVFAQRRNQLIHNAAITANELIFRFLAIKRQRHIIHRQMIERLQRFAHRHFQRGGRTQARPLGDVAADNQVGAAKACVPAL